MSGKNQKLKLFISILKTNGDINSQKELGSKLGYKTESAFSQIVNNKVPIPESLYPKLKSLYPELYEKIFGTDENSNFVINSDVKLLDDEEEVEVIINKNGIKFFLYPDDSTEIEVLQVPFPAYASYIEAYNDEEKLNQEFNKIRFKVDKIGRGYYIAFKTKNDSMNGGGLYDTPGGADVLAREIGRHLWQDGFHKSIYGFILITQRGIYHKDIKQYDKKTGILTLSSRNPECNDFEIHINEVFKIFNVIKRSF